MNGSLQWSVRQDLPFSPLRDQSTRSALKTPASTRRSRQGDAHGATSGSLSKTSPSTLPARDARSSMSAGSQKMSPEGANRSKMPSEEKPRPERLQNGSAMRRHLSPVAETSSLQKGPVDLARSKTQSIEVEMDDVSFPDGDVFQKRQKGMSIQHRVFSICTDEQVHLGKHL